MHILPRLLSPSSLLSLILSYAEEFCISARSPITLQRLLKNFANVTTSCGLMKETAKSKLLCRPPSTRRNSIPFCNKRDVVQDYVYLGIPISSLNNPSAYISQLRDQLGVILRSLRSIT